MKVLSIGTLKGGTGKSRTAENLAAALALAGRKVLEVDFDLQGDVTVALGVAAPRNATIGDVLLTRLDADHPGPRALQDIRLDRTDLLGENPHGGQLHLIPSVRLPMSRAETAMKDNPGIGTKLLANLLRDVAHEYDYALIDNKPDLGILHSAALEAADAVLGIMTADTAPLRGGLSLRQTVEHFREAGGNLEFLGVLLNMWEEKEEADWVLSELTKQNVEILATRIPRSKLVSKCFALGKPVVLQFPNSDVTDLYFQAAKEVIDKMRKEAV